MVDRRLTPESCKDALEVDGSLRDIYVLETTLEDWRKVVAMLAEAPSGAVLNEEPLPTALPDLRGLFVTHGRLMSLLSFHVGRVSSAVWRNSPDAHDGRCFLASARIASSIASASSSGFSATTLSGTTTYSLSNPRPLRASFSPTMAACFHDLGQFFLRLPLPTFVTLTVEGRPPATRCACRPR